MRTRVVCLGCFLLLSIAIVSETDSQGLQAAASIDLDGQENTISMHSERMAMVSRLLAWQQHFFDSIYADRA